MAALIRQAKTENRIMPLMVVILMAFGYGALHAAGPGHGKAVAVSFMLSRNATLGGGGVVRRTDLFRRDGPSKQNSAWGSCRAFL